MRVAIGSVPDHLNIRRPAGRVDPVTVRALTSLEKKRLRKWAEENKIKIEDTSPKNAEEFLKYYDEYKAKLFESLTENAGTLRTVTRRLRRQLGSDVERLLYSNPTIYATVLATAVAKWKRATAPPPLQEPKSKKDASPEIKKLTNTLDRLVETISPLVAGWVEQQSRGEDNS